MKERALKIANRLDEIGRVKDMGRPPIKDTEREAATLIRELQSRLEEVNQKVDELEKENASLRQDAARYRWLRDGSDLVASWYGGIALAGFAKTNKHKSELDTAIDAAMQVNKGN